PLDIFSTEDDRMNEISVEDGRNPSMPILDRIFNSAELQILTKGRPSRPNKIKRNDEDTTRSSKHAHSMITSMLSFVSSVVNFGRTFMRNE
ncbi:hypothetical protein KR222_006195, partial [Zaprionus bogoriensis]